ncbi:MAG TPA: hypothetical protein VN790_00355 [Steroidobacteraceae bacterium]|nr:hypothetical protein [Steroidobacteraceae bacterium]
MNNEQPNVTESDADFERRTTKLLRDSADALEGRVRSRLTAARYAALAELEKRTGKPRLRVPGAWLPAGVLAAAAVLAVAVWIGQPVGGPATLVAEATLIDEDGEILASNEGPDLYADDPDFYEWAGTDQNGGAG